MKHITILLCTFLFLNVFAFTQKISTEIRNETDREQKSIYAIPGSHLLHEKEKSIRNYLRQHPNAKNLMKEHKIGWNFLIGDPHTWWATNLVNYNEYEVSSTCRAIGDHCYIFVEDAIWNNRITQNGIENILENFENSTPANSNKGIYQTDVETFGEPPDVDLDPRIIILILDIVDGFTGSGGYVAGYFYSANEYPDGDSALGGTRSNHTEIYYIDANPADLTTVNGLNDGMATTAHEFQHMIHWRWDDEELTFINEGCSMVAEHICGYNLDYWFNLYQEDTNRYLFYWDDDDPFPDYARAALWTLYLYEQYPNNFLKELVANQLIGINGIDNTLMNHSPNIPIPPGRLFKNIFADWLIANYANDKSLERKYYYDYQPISKPSPIYTHIGSSDVPEVTNTISNLAAHYISFSGGSNLSMYFSSSNNNIKVKAIKIGSTEIEDVPINSIYTPTGYGDIFSEVTFVVYNLSPIDAAEYKYYAIGPELRYDDGTPEGYLGDLSPGDSVSVHFSGKPSTKLDSIKIAFRRSGTIQMGIWKFTGSYYTSPFGENLYNPQDIFSPDSTTSKPYPEPFDNWFTVDLSNHNIDANNDFIVSFLIGNNPNAPAIMYSSEPDVRGEIKRSYLYINDYKSGGWEYIVDTSNRGNINNLLVRVYTSIKNNSLSVNQNTNNESTKSFNLEQNFPNPFNPGTAIHYRLTNNFDVILTIYDLMGNEIYSQARVNQPAGDYVVNWYGKDNIGQSISAGIYIYTLQVGEYIQAKKMVFLK